MIEAADIDNLIAVKVCMAGAVGAAMIDTKRCFEVVEVLYSRSNLLGRRAMVLHCRCSDSVALF